MLTSFDNIGRATMILDKGVICTIEEHKTNLGFRDLWGFVIPMSWPKTSDNNHIKKGGSNHPTGNVESIH